MVLSHHHQQHPTESVPVLPMDDLLSTHLFSSSSEPTSSVHSPPHPPPPPPAKRKRSLPGQPDPDSEVVALSPNSLLATDRFVCEVCSKGFRRDQNLQLHRRGHNLPWKLKQRSKEEAVRKKVYVCPEAGCVHHDPGRALGDLTGIKKHFYRKHGEKKWKCDKCSKKYAVHSDWKAHSKTCGKREYKCDCGTIFARRDSFITHKAFCDALVEDTTRASFRNNPFLPPPPPPPQQQQHHQSAGATSSPPSQHTNTLQNPNQTPSTTLTTASIPPWLGQAWPPPPPPALLFTNPPLLQNPTPYPPPQPHMSATALLQKAAQLGAIISSNTNQLNNHEDSSFLLQDMMMMKSMPSSFDHGGDLNAQFGGNDAISDGLTRDFLGISPLITHADVYNLNVAALADANGASPSPRASLKGHADV